MRPFHIQCASPSGRPGRSIARACYIKGIPSTIHIIPHCTQDVKRNFKNKKIFIFSKFLLTFQIFYDIIYSQGKEGK